MKKTLYKSLLVFTVCTSAAHAVDYTKCMEFINPKDPFSSKSVGNAGWGMMGIYRPFELLSDGKIKPNDDVISYDTIDDKNQEVIQYDMPTFGVISLNESDKKNPFKHDTKRITVIIQRDDKGNIVEIINDENVSQSDIDQQVKIQRAHWERNTPEEMKRPYKRLEEKSGQKIQLPFSRYASSSVKFEVKNGQCVPVESKNKILIEPKKDGQTFETTNYNVNLCKDIDNFLTKNPEAASCFKKDLNKQITSIFERYKPKDQQFSSMVGPFGGGIGYGGVNSGFGMSFGFGSVEQMMSQGMFWGDEDQKSAIRKTTGSSPIIAGHMILQNCYNQGLGTFIDDPSIWEEAGVKTQKSSGEAAAKQ